MEQKRLKRFDRSSHLHPAPLRHIAILELWYCEPQDESTSRSPYIATPSKWSRIAHEIYTNLGNALKDRGDLDEAIVNFQRAVNLCPQHPTLLSNLIVALNYVQSEMARWLRRESERWNNQYVVPLSPMLVPTKTAWIRTGICAIGYVSADFCEHASMHFLNSFLGNHDHSQFEIVCYAEVSNPDGLTGAGSEIYADRWWSTVGVSDDQLADQVREDEIDILVELKLHTSGNRLLALQKTGGPSSSVGWVIQAPAESRPS